MMKSPFTNALFVIFSLAVELNAAPPLPSDRTLNSHLIELSDPSFAIKETDHFTIAYDTEHTELIPLIGRLEGIRKAVLRFCTGHDLPISDTDHRLGVLFFDQHEAFMQFARTNNIGAHSFSGFYHQETNIAAFLNTKNNPAMKNIAQRIEALEQQLSPATTGSRRAGRSASDQRNLLRELTSLRAQRDTIAKRFNQLVIQHEAAHQVLFNLGVHVRNADNSMWLVEGLACQFEVPQPDRQGRLTQVNHLRLADLRDALGVESPARSISDAAYQNAVADGRWVPLRLFIPDNAHFEDADERMIARYAQAWGVVHYLERNRPEDLSRYIKALMSRSPGVRIPTEQAMEEFEGVFGPIDDSFDRQVIEGLLILRLDLRKAGRSE
jgi:hypothetical protein